MKPVPKPLVTTASPRTTTKATTSALSEVERVVDARETTPRRVLAVSREHEDRSEPTANERDVVRGDAARGHADTVVGAPQPAPGERDGDDDRGEIEPEKDAPRPHPRVGVCVPARAGAMKLGMFCEVRFISSPTEAIILPSTAIMQEQDNDYVLIETTKGKYVRRKVESESISLDKVLIKKGIGEGENVVIKGGIYLNI